MINLKETERIKQELKKNPDNYKSIIENTELGICITDEDGNFFDINENYARMYGYDKNEMIGQSFLMVVPVDDKIRLQELHDLFMRMKDEIMRNWEVQRKDGETFKIFADAGYASKIGGSPKKVTFVWPRDAKFKELMRGE